MYAYLNPEVGVKSILKTLKVPEFKFLSVVNRYVKKEFTGSSISPYTMYLPATPILYVVAFLG